MRKYDMYILIIIIQSHTCCDLFESSRGLEDLCGLEGLVGQEVTWDSGPGGSEGPGKEFLGKDQKNECYLTFHFDS